MLFVCHMNRTQMFVQMFIKVLREGKPIHNRSVLVDQLCKSHSIIVWFQGRVWKWLRTRCFCLES